MAVIGVLASTLVGIINPVRQIQKTKDSQRKADIKQIQTALELYRADKGRYPANNRIRINANQCGSASLEEDGVTYMNKIPCNPAGGSYMYALVSGNTSKYTIGVCMEVEDPNAYENGHGCGTAKYFEVDSP